MFLAKAAFKENETIFLNCTNFQVDLSEYAPNLRGSGKKFYHYPFDKCLLILRHVFFNQICTTVGPLKTVCGLVVPVLALKEYCMRT